MLATVDGNETYFCVQGKGEPLVLLHGWGVSSESLAGVAKAFEDKFAVYSVDLPGFGWSAPPPSPWGSLEYAAHLNRLMDVAGIPSANLLGHSFGGRVAIALASRFPKRVRRLVLVASSGIRPRRTVRYYSKVGLAKMARRVFSSTIWGKLGDRIQRAVIARVGSRDHHKAGPMRPTFLKLVNEDLRPLLSSVLAPTLIIWGSHDREIPEASMRIMTQGIRGSRLEILEGAGHFPFLEMPERFAELVGAFLREGDVT